MTETLFNILWESQLDARYACQVVRLSEGMGRLTVKDGDKVLLDKEVPLAYGAAFGPDVDDVLAWQQDCMAVVDREAF